MRSLLDALATRFCSLNGEPANGDVIRKLLWQAYDSAAQGRLDESEVLIGSVRAQLDEAEQAVGIISVALEAKMMPKFTHGVFMKLRRHRGDA